MQLWRISNHADLTGLGGELLSGRWHTASPGKRIIYLSEHPALALIEALANLRGDPRLFPDTFVLLKVATTKTVSCIGLQPNQPSRIRPVDMTATQKIGDALLADRSSALLRVPSIPSPESWNYLFNPLHPDSAPVTLDWARRIAYDKSFTYSHA